MSERRVLIADDEPAARRGVCQLLAAWPDFAVVGESRNGIELLAALNDLRPDVVFLDIQMPGMDGFEVIRRRTPERMPCIVFLTAWDDFALQAFEAQALDYLLKPVTEARFSMTMTRLRRQLACATPLAHDPRIVVNTANGARILSLREIDWIEAFDNYTRLWIGQTSFLLRESMRDLERRVMPHGFVRAHRSALVRLDAVRKLLRSGDGGMNAVLTGGAEIPVSRRRRAVFCAAIRGPQRSR